MKYEMQWTTRSFLHKSQEWHNRFEEPNIEPGPKAYSAVISMEVHGIGIGSAVPFGKFGVSIHDVTPVGWSRIGSDLIDNMHDVIISQSITSVGSGNTTFASTMTRVPITNLFNAYDLQVNALDEDKISSQDVVNYCEARFRVALQEMMRRSERDQKWMYKFLIKEMVLFFA